MRFTNVLLQLLLLPFSEACLRDASATKSSLTCASESVRGSAFSYALLMSQAPININKTSSSAIAERPRCGGGELWQKYKRENGASNIALSYSVDVDESPFYCFMSPYLYLMQNFATFRH